MNETKDYSWIDQLKDHLQDIVKSGIEQIRKDVRKAELEVLKQIEWRGHLRSKMAKAVTGAEALAIQAVSSLYFVEKAIRAVLGSTFASCYLSLYQKLTSDATELVKKELGAVEIPQPLPMSLADGTGGLTVAMLLTSADEEAVKALLPAGLGLSSRDQLGALRDQVGAGRYPIMIGLGFNSGVRPVWNQKSFVEMNYLELTIGVPGVRLTREFADCPEGPFFYIPALLLNSVTPTLLGWAFGFKKRIKRFKADACSYQVSRLLSGRPLLMAQVTSNPDSKPQLANTIGDLTPWLDFLDRPIVTRTWWGDLRFTFFHWDWPFTPANPARVQFSLSTGELPLLPVAPAVFTSLPGADIGNPGVGPVLGKAYLMSVPWRLLLPFGIGVLKWNAPFWRRMVGKK